MNTPNNMSLTDLTQKLQSVSLGKLDLKNMRQSDLVALQKLLTPKMTSYIPHTPTPKQAAFLLLDCKEAFYGGSAGGGKSDALLMAGLQYVDIKGYSGILFRKTYADLTKPGALIERATEWLSNKEGVKWCDKDKRFEFYRKYGPHKELISMLQFGYLENESDRLNYQGGEYQFVGFDELTHISLNNYLYLFSRLRRLKGTAIPLRVRGASNPPDDDGGIWVKTRFIDEGPSKGRIFIPAGMNDNPYLDVEEYKESLENLDPVTRARLRDGDWSITRKGNMFKRDWFETVDTLPPGCREVRWWDMAATDEEKAKRKNKSNEPDFTASMRVGERNGIFYIKDIINERLSPEKTQNLQGDTARSDGYNVPIIEEQEPGSSGISVVDIKSRTTFKGYNYRGQASTGSKPQRAQIASAAAEKHHIKIVRGCRNVEAFLNQAESFPGGIHDDMVDCLSGSIAFLSALPPPGTPTCVEREETYSGLSSELELGAGYYNSYGYDI